MKIGQKSEIKTTLADLLPYQSGDEATGVLWLKDGSATTTLKVTPKNILCLTEEDLDLLRSGLTILLNQFSEGTIVQFLVVREPTKPTTDLALRQWHATHGGNNNATQDAGSPSQKLFDSKKAVMQTLCENNQIFQTQIYLTVKVSPFLQEQIATKMGPLSFLKFRNKQPQFKSVDTVIKEIEAMVGNIKATLESQEFAVEAVPITERVKFIYEYLNPKRTFGQDRFDLNQSTDLSEKVTTTDLIENRNGLQLGHTKLRIGTLKTLPDASVPGLVSQFATLPQAFSFVLTLLVLPQTKERERLTRKQRLISGLASGNTVRNLTAENQLTDIEDTLTAMISSGEKLVAASFHFILQEQDNENSHSSFLHLLEEGEKLGPGCQWFEETIGAYPVFFGTLPFAPEHMTRPRRVLTSTLSDFLPLFGMGPGHKEASILFETPFQSVLGYSLYEKSPSANAILIGSTGSGKSTLACGLILGMTAGAS